MGGRNEQPRYVHPQAKGRVGSGGAVFAALKRQVVPVDLQKRYEGAGDLYGVDCSEDCKVREARDGAEHVRDGWAVGET